MTTTTTSASGLSVGIRAEQLSALATPAAKLLLGMSAVMAAVSLTANLSAVDDLTLDASVELAMHASTVATLVFALLAGIYSATSDFRFGLVDQRLLGEPNRATIVGAKAAVAAGVGLLYALVGAIAAVGSAYAYFATQGESFPVGSDAVAQALIGVLVAAPLFAVAGVGVGFLVRNQPIAIGGSLAWMLVVEPILIVGLPDVGWWLPGASGIAATNAPDAAPSQVSAALTLAAYTAITLAGAIVTFRRADIG